MTTQKRLISEVPVDDPPIRFNLRAKMIAVLTIALSIVFTAIFAWAYHFTTSRTTNRLRDDLNWTLNGAISLVDGDELMALYREGARDEAGFSQDPRYLHILSRLEEVHSLEPRAFLYTFVPGDKDDSRRAGKRAASPEVIYLVDVYARINQEKAAHFLESDQASPFVMKAWNEKRMVERPDIYFDKFGRWMSSYAPIKNKQGETVALMGVDFEAAYVEEIQGEIKRSVLLVFGLSYSVALILVYIAAGVFSRPIMVLTRAAEQLREDSLGSDAMASPHLHKRRDELGALARAFSRMSRRLGLAFQEIETQNAELEERVKERTADLSREREKSELLLQNILPSDIATRLKEAPSDVIADGYEAVTVLFADIVGFTDMSTRVSPLALVSLLNEIFSAFDRLATKHGVEKIKTIGDAYMVVGGLPVPRDDHAIAICDMALDMQAVMEELELTHNGIGIRIGVHTGPVVAGVLGTKKFSYDLWGDTVNVASRMESHGERGRIQITQSVVENLAAVFEVDERGPISLKGRGQMTTYWLVKRRIPA